MKVFKKLSFFVVVLPLFFGLLTFFSNKASAQTTTCTNGVSISSPTSIQKLGNSTKFTVRVTNLSPQNTCTYVPFVSSGSNVNGWNFKFATSTTATPQSTLSLPVSSENFKNLVVVATPPSSWFNNPTKNEFRLRLKYNGNQIVPFKDIPYLAGYACNNKASLTATSINGSGDNKSRTYELKLLNNDESGCPATRYSLSTVTPNNSTWNTTYLTSAGANLGTTNITRNPGQSFSFKIKIVPPSGASAGDKLIRVSATDPARVSASRDLTYKITSSGSGGGTGGGTTTGCVELAPKIEVSPLNRNGIKGSEKQYEIKITNIDEEKSCPNSVKVTLKRDLPGDQNTSWTGRFENNELSVPRGESRKTTLFIKSPKTASLGEKSIFVKASRPAGSRQITRSKTIKYTVVPDSTDKPTNPPTKKPTTPPTKEPTKGPEPTSCVRKNPVLTIDPESINSLAGREVAYEVTVKNADEGPCADRRLTLQRTVPSPEWTGSWSADNTDFTLAKNATKKFTLKLKSPNNASVGTKNITINLKNSNDQTVGSKKITYIVGSETTTPPPPDGAARLNFILGVDGIGTTPRVPLGGNKNPNDIFRQLNFKVYSASDNTLKYEVGNFPFTYNQDSQKFQTVYDFPEGANVPDGTYNIYVEGSPFLITQYPGSVTIKKGETTNLTSQNFYLITGNINNSDQSQNKIDILDYNVLISCSIFAKTTELCDSNENYSKWSDLNNNGVVDQDDYTLWLREFANQQGAQLPN